MNKDAIYELITDRTSNSYYNISDLNRVETAVKAIAEYMGLIGYTVTISTKSTGDWTIKHYPTDVQMARYLKNLVSIRNQLNKKKLNLPQSMTMLNYEDANDIEKLLKRLNDTLMSVITSYRYTGVAISGGSQFIDVADLSPYMDIFGTLTWRDNAPVLENEILELGYADFDNGILQDL